MCLPLLLLALGACSTPPVKPDAFDPATYARFFEGIAPESAVMTPTLDLMETSPTPGQLTFAGIRTGETTRYGVVVSCRPRENILEFLPLAPGETPLDVLGHTARKNEIERKIAAASEVVTYPLKELMEEGRFASPLPRPSSIFAASANYPSHLRHDLAVEMDANKKSMLRKALPRVFRKFPPTLPREHEGDKNQPSFPGFIGPFDPISYPSQTLLPPHTEEPLPDPADTRVDYEVEIGVVFGMDLTWDDIQGDRAEEKIWDAVAGFVLVSDTKSRNPQVVLKMARDDEKGGLTAAPYFCGVEDLDDSLGIWDSKTCDWWSYAASWGDYAAVGPFFVSSDFPGIKPRAMLSARSYGAPQLRGTAIPNAHEQDLLYLRQCSVTTDHDTHPDSLVWGIPQIVRSILLPDGVLRFEGGSPQIRAGDIICLGTPGGTVITSKKESLLDIINTLLFWWSPLDFHDFIFEDNALLYLRHGDQVLYWADGLGFQLHRIRERQRR